MCECVCVWPEVVSAVTFNASTQGLPHSRAGHKHREMGEGRGQQ